LNGAPADLLEVVCRGKHFKDNVQDQEPDMVRAYLPSQTLMEMEMQRMWMQMMMMRTSYQIWMMLLN
jgi:hypothetical protein